MKEPDPDAGTEVRSLASKRKSEAPVKDKPLTLRRQGPLGSTPVVAPRGVKLLLERPQAVRLVPPAWLLPEFDILRFVVGGCRSLKGGQQLGQLWMPQFRMKSVKRESVFVREKDNVLEKNILQSCP